MTRHLTRGAPTTGSLRDYGGPPAENYERYFVSAIGRPLALERADALRAAPGGAPARPLADRALELDPGQARAASVPRAKPTATFGKLLGDPRRSAMSSPNAYTHVRRLDWRSGD